MIGPNPFVDCVLRWFRYVTCLGASRSVEASGVQSESLQPSVGAGGKPCAQRGTSMDPIKRGLSPGQILWTPGNGTPPKNQRAFRVLAVDQEGIRIDKLAGQIRFDWVEYALRMVMSWGGTVPIGSSQGIPAAPETLEWGLHVSRGNFTRTATYVAPILVHCGLARYVMMGDRKGITLTETPAAVSPNPKCDEA